MKYSKFASQGLFKIPDALNLGHDEVRAELVRATLIPGRIGEAAGRVACLCLPHFEQEEEVVFPVFGVLRELASGTVRAEMAEILPLVSDFHSWRNSLGNQHESIAPALHELMLAAYNEDNREIVEFTYSLRMHERLEEEVIFPTVFLIGNYVQQKLGI
jgi:hemerythrin superfamily protein